MNKRLEQLKQEYNETLNRMQDLGDILAHCAEMDTSHCGLDAANNEEELQSLEELLGMEVVAICGSKTKCEGCQRGNTYCVKLELVGGDYICLAKPQQDERPVISFDEEEDKVFTHHGNCDVSRRINEKNLSTYQEALDDAVHDVKAHGATHFSCPLAVLVAQREIEIEANPMQKIKRKADDFMAYIDSVVKG